MQLVGTLLYIRYFMLTRKGPTMFPIIFAAISGRSMKMIARYLAEKGSKISVSWSIHVYMYRHDGISTSAYADAL
jgi:hypothetical protein